MKTLYLGYDPAEDEAYHVARASAMVCSVDLDVYPIKQDLLRKEGLFYRKASQVDNQWYDDIDGRPFSTEFAFTRFLTAHIHRLRGLKGWTAFTDSDFMFRTNPEELWELADQRYAVMVVKHDYQPTEETKMRGQLQQPYPRKNWSSLILWNTDHPAHQNLTIHDVNTRSGRELHNFYWLDDTEIGAIPEEWNWLEGHSNLNLEPKAVHYTRGVPSRPGHEAAPYAEEWRDYLGLR